MYCMSHWFFSICDVENPFSPYKEIMYDELHNQDSVSYLFLWKISSERKMQRSVSAAKDRHWLELQAWKHYQIRTEQARGKRYNIGYCFLSLRENVSHVCKVVDTHIGWYAATLFCVELNWPVDTENGNLLFCAMSWVTTKSFFKWHFSII